MKHCSRCGKFKPLAEFNKRGEYDKHGRPRYRSECKSCGGRPAVQPADLSALSPMLTLGALLGAIDDAISESGLSDCEALRRAGFDASLAQKWRSENRWPNMATLAGILDAANVSLPRFAEMVETRMQLDAHMPKEVAA